MLLFISAWCHCSFPHCQLLQTHFPPFRVRGFFVFCFVFLSFKGYLCWVLPYKLVPNQPANLRRPCWQWATLIIVTCVVSLGLCSLLYPVFRQPCFIFWIWAGNPVILPSLLTFSYQISSWTCHKKISVSMTVWSGKSTVPPLLLSRGMGRVDAWVEWGQGNGLGS